jgi:hypothetical protein
MAETLEQVKDRVRKSFLGQGGIHGVGISRSQQAIRVYLSPGNAQTAQATIDNLKKVAAPYSVLVVEEEAPRVL